MKVQAILTVGVSAQSTDCLEDAHRQAARLGLTGVVQSLEDGKVRIIAEGEKDDVNGFIKSFVTSDRLALVAEIAVWFTEPTDRYDSFSVAQDI
jgi:acylphosphatase